MRTWLQQASVPHCSVVTYGYTRDSAIRAYVHDRTHTTGVKGAAPRLGKHTCICTHEIIGRVYMLAETLTSVVSVAFVTLQTIAPDTMVSGRLASIAHVRVTVRARLILLR